MAFCRVRLPEDEYAMPLTNGRPLDLSERVICVDESDILVGDAEKIAAHTTGALHRAFSVFLFDQKGRLLMQRRSLGKYHAAGLWANSCCGHPRPGEETHEAAIRRVREELGIPVSIEKGFRFRYYTEMDNGLVENEVVHMLFGRFSGPVYPDPSEVSEIVWHEVEEIVDGAEDTQNRLAPWFRIYLKECLPMIVSWRDRLGRKDTPF
jgi:isopentenyl-diphosphate delta-isomerase